MASLKDVTINWSPFVGSMARKGNTVYLYVPHGEMVYCYNYLTANAVSHRG